MIRLLLLKHIYGPFDEGLCERWVCDPYFRVPHRWCVSAGAIVLKTGVALPEPACRGGLQTTPRCCV